MPKSLGCPLWGKVTPGGGTQAHQAACPPQCKATTQAPLPSSGPAGAPTQGWVASCCALSRTWKRKIQKPKFFRTKLKTFCPVRVQCVTPAHIARKKTLVGKVNPAHRSCVNLPHSHALGKKKFQKKIQCKKVESNLFQKKIGPVRCGKPRILQGMARRRLVRAPAQSPAHPLVRPTILCLLALARAWQAGFGFAGVGLFLRAPKKRPPRNWTAKWRCAQPFARSFVTSRVQPLSEFFRTTKLAPSVKKNFHT